MSEALDMLTASLRARGESRQAGETEARAAMAEADEQWKRDNPFLAGPGYVLEQRAAEQARADEEFRAAELARQDAILADPGYPQEHKEAIALGRMSPEERGQFVAARREARRLALHQGFAEWLDPHARAAKEEREAAAGRSAAEALHQQFVAAQARVAATRARFYDVDGGNDAA